MSRTPRPRKDQDIDRVLLTPTQIQAGVKKLARRVSRDFAGKRLMIVAILKGSVVFLSDFIRHLTIPCQIEFMAVASYGDQAESSGVVQLIMDLRQNPERKDLLLLEDLLDTGLTVQYLLENLRTRNPRSVKVCALLDKPANRRAPVQADYAAFKIPNEFVVGYGLDYAEHYRQLPYIGVLKKKIYSK